MTARIIAMVLAGMEAAADSARLSRGRRLRVRAPVSGCVALTALAGALSAGEPRFASEPKVEAAPGGGYAIRFAVESPADVAVAIVDRTGRIVRHLAAGVLGDNPPPPLVKGDLSQNIVWDGRDDAGREVAGDCSAKVSLGTRPRFDGLYPIQPPSVCARGIVGLAAHPDGRLFVLQGSAWERQVGSPELVVFDRGGKYLRTIVPFRADLPPGKRPRTYETDGGKTDRPSKIFPGLQGIYRNTMRIAKCEDGEDRLVVVSGRGAPVEGGKPARRLIRIGLDGSADPGTLGPILPAEFQTAQRFFLAASPDGATFYLAGAGSRVWRAKWGDGKFEPVLGKEEAEGEGGAGKAPDRFDQPRGLAVAPDGRLLVCDWMNDRIQVFSADLKYLKSLQVPGPEQVAINPRTGELFALSVRDRGAKDVYYSTKPIRWDAFEDKSVVKFRSIEDFTEVARCDLPKRKLYMHDPGPIMVLDASAPRPVLWISCVGRIAPGDQIWRIEDEGDRLQAGAGAIEAYYYPFGRGAGALAADRGTGDCYWAGRTSPTILKIDGKTGEVSRMDRMASAIFGPKPSGYKPWQPVAAAMDSKGRIYFRLLGMWSGPCNFIVRFNPDQTQAPFADKAGERQDNPIPDIKLMKLEGVAGALHVSCPSHGYHSGGLGVAWNGDIYVIDQAPDGRHRSPSERNVMNIFDPDGILKKASAIPYLTSGAWGPRFDSKGNMYLTESFRPLKAPYRAGDVGSLVKINGTETELIFGERAGDSAAYEMRRAERDFRPVAVRNAAWIYHGVSPVPMGHCVCASCPFDLDRFDRIAVADSANHRVKLLDSNGNEIGCFGEPANRDSKGPGSELPIPEIPLASVGSVACGGGLVYVYDDTNNRILRVRLEAAETRTVPIPR